MVCVVLAIFGFQCGNLHSNERLCARLLFAVSLHCGNIRRGILWLPAEAISIFWLRSF